MTDRKIDTNKIKLLIEMYNEGQSYKKIANKLNVSDKTIANYVKILIKQGKINKRPGNKKNLSKDEVELLMTMYNNKNSFREIAEKMHISESTAQNRTKQLIKQEKINKRQGNAKKMAEDKIKLLIDMYNNGQTYKKIAQVLAVSTGTIARYVHLLIDQGKIIRRNQAKAGQRMHPKNVGQRMHPKNMTYSYLIDLILMEKGYNYISAGHLNTRINKTNVKKHFNNFKKWGISKVEDISDRVKNETLTNAYNEVDNLIKSNPDVPKELPGRGQRLDASAILHLYCAGYKIIYIAKHFSYPLNSVRSVIARARKSGRVTKKKNITDNQSKLLVKLYNEGQSYKKIARELNISQATTTKYAKQLVKQGKIEPRLQTANVIHLSDTEIEKLIELYNNGLFYKEIARSLHVSESTVKKRVKQLIKQGKINHRPGQVKRFSKDEIELLIAMYNNRRPIKEIAQALGVSKGIITRRVNLLIEQDKIIKRPRYKKKINCN